MERGMGVGEGGDKKGDSGIKRETVNIMGNCGIMIL